MTSCLLDEFAALMHSLECDDSQSVSEVLHRQRILRQALAFNLPKNNMTAIEYASAYHSADMVDLFTRFTIWPSEDARLAAMNAAIWRAAGNGHMDTVQLLLGCDAVRSAVDTWGLSTLCSAAVSGHIDIVELLAPMCCALLERVKYDFAPTWALVYSQSACYESLIRHGFPVDVFTSLLTGNRGQMTGLFARDQKIQYMPIHGMSCGILRGPCLLHLAILMRDADSVDLLLRAGADPNVRTENGLSALCVAAMVAGGTLDLLQARALERGTGAPGTVLETLQKRGAFQDVAALVALDNAPELRTMLKRGEPPREEIAGLVVAVYLNNAHAVEEILDGAACAGWQFSPTPLALSLKNDDSAMTERLLRGGASPSDIGVALGIAAHDDSERLALLLRAGLDPNMSIGDSYILHECCEMGALAATGLLLQAGACISLAENNAYGFTPLHVLALSNAPNLAPLASILRKAGADVTAADRLFGGSPCQWLAARYRFAPTPLDEAVLDAFT